MILVPPQGASVLIVTKCQNHCDTKVTIGEAVKKIVFRGANTLFKNFEILNSDIIVEFPDAPDGIEYVNVLHPRQRLKCQLFLGLRNVLYVEGVLDLTPGTVIKGKILGDGTIIFPSVKTIF